MVLFFVICCLLLCALNYSSTLRVEKRVNMLTRPDKSKAAMIAFVLASLVSGSGYAQEPVTDPPRQMMQLSPETRSWYRNPDGSCVQCSIGLAGVHANDLNAALLLWDSEYGPAERGGSYPSRVEAYCNKRGIKAWSVTGQTIDDTLPWMEWSARTGRFAAIGAGTAHFQTLYGFDPRTREFFVLNNNSTHRVDRYSERDFRALHAASGFWVVILEKPSSVPPQINPWWK
ncbi:hypothetical protein [Schlesneria sp. DSM 10557]|uniref:hypothetical protein n=1 Tax=Schlesneria sp. DSM 10557 TaxID=3044399 RepID=UPI0035A18EB0